VSFNWGSVQLGRNLLRETFDVNEQGGDRTLDFDGQESNPPLTRAVLTATHDNINAMEADSPVAVTWTDKPERNGFYQVKANSSTLTEYKNDTVTADWKVTLSRLGAVGEVDIQSRLTGVVRLNDFSLTGERWHAPAIGHFGYYTGATSPSTMTRATSDGTITVYRSVPAGASPRWGCDPLTYLKGRVRVADTVAGLEVDGTERSLPAAGWALSNGLVNVVPTASGGVIDVQAYTGGAWHSKLWNVTVAGSGVAAWDSASILRNDLEHAILRLSASRSPGRVTLDLALRRGARTVEGYLQSGSSATLAVYLRTLETNTSAAASGYVTATGNDADGNRFAAGSARSFTAHTNGGVSKASATALDFWLGVVAGGGSPASGDAATDLRNMYIGSLAEATYAVRR
jgi:hypothetical protein